MIRPSGRTRARTRAGAKGEKESTGMATSGIAQHGLSQEKGQQLRVSAGRREDNIGFVLGHSETVSQFAARLFDQIVEGMQPVLR